MVPLEITGVLYLVNHRSQVLQKIYFECFALPSISGTGGEVFFGICVFLFDSVPCGSFGLGLRIPALLIVLLLYTDKYAARVIISILRANITASEYTNFFLFCNALHHQL